MAQIYCISRNIHEIKIHSDYETMKNSEFSPKEKKVLKFMKQSVIDLEHQWPQ